jgi:arylsulfatase A
MPILKDPERSVRTAHVHNTFKHAYAMRQGDWVLVTAKSGYHSKQNKAWEAKHQYPADTASEYELYNIVEDIGQRHNLADKHPEKVKALQALLTQIQQQGYSAPRFSK